MSEPRDPYRWPLAPFVLIGLIGVGFGLVAVLDRLAMP